MNRERRILLALILGVLVFYLWSLAPSVLWGDDAFFQRSAFDGTLPRDGGGHWLWFVLARAIVQIPLGEVAYRVNLLSGLAAVITVGLLYGAGRALGISETAAAVAALSLGVAHTFWMHAVRAEVYTVFTALLVLELSLLFLWTRDRLWPLLAALGLVGLTLLGHQMAVLLWPAMGWLILRQLRWLSLAQIALAVGAFLIGLIPAVFVIHQQIAAADAVQSLLLYFTHSGRDFGVSMFDYSPGQLHRDAALWLGFLGLQFPSPALLAGGLALVSIRRWIADARWQMLAVLYLTDTAFAFSYRVNDFYVFYLPSYVAFALFIGLGWDFLTQSHRQLSKASIQVALIAAVVVLPPFVYFGLATTLTTLGLNPLQIRELPGREPNRYFLWPGKESYFGAYEYGTELLNGLPPESILIADYTPYQTLLYLQVVEHQRPDVSLVPIGSADDLVSTLQQQPMAGSVFLADRDPRYYDWAAIPGAQLDQQGLAYRIVRLP